MAYLFIALMLLLTCYGQLILKWRVNLAGSLPQGLSAQLQYLFDLLSSPWVISGLLAAFLASICWMLVLTKLELSRAYPFTALSFLLIFAFSWFFFGDAITPGKLAGTALIIAGICTIAVTA